MNTKDNYSTRGVIVGAIIGALVVAIPVVLYNWFVVFQPGNPAYQAWEGYEPFCIGLIALPFGAALGALIGGAIGERIPRQP